MRKELGNQFLDDTRQAEVLIHVVDIAGTTDIQGQPVPPGTHNQLEDVKFVQDEFDLWFADILKRDWDKITRDSSKKNQKLTDGIAKPIYRFRNKDFQVQDVLQKLGLSQEIPKK